MAILILVKFKDLFAKKEDAKTMRNVQKFDFEGMDFRTTVKNGEPLFVAKDVAQILGFRNSRDAVRTHVFDDDKGVETIYTPGGNQKMSVINESGLYGLIFGSRLPSAQKFKRWVTSEVLPALRKDGVFMRQDTAIDLINNPRRMIDVLTKYAETQDKLNEVSAENKAMKPKALFADSVASSNGTILIRELAVLLKQNGLNIGEKRLFERLRNDGYLVKRKGSSSNLPTQKAMDMGLFKVSEASFMHNSGKPGIGLTPRVTGKGQRYFVDKYCPRNMELKEVGNV